ncbi:MAG: hypothetical protein LW650_07475 [Planctomycetaceae bacterium]|jgi:hypothetical protein|nr:hypothetical protein [Phycisphaerales bacterium]MCE2653333.1 hypothetical protein [Planctomycetaceae bacterium]
MPNEPDIVIPADDHLVWIRRAEIRFGVPGVSGFVDTRSVPSDEHGIDSLIWAAAVIPNSHRCLLYNAERSTFVLVDWQHETVEETPLAMGSGVSIASMAALEDRLFVMVQDLDKMTDSLQELRGSSLEPVVVGGIDIWHSIKWPLSLRLAALNGKLLMYEPIDGRLWSWSTDSATVPDSVHLGLDAVIGLGQPGRLWTAQQTSEGSVRRLDRPAPPVPFKTPSGQPIAGVVEHRDQLWAVDELGNWLLLSASA